MADRMIDVDRLLMITKRFWPHTDDAIGRLSDLAESLRRSGIRPTIVAARFAASWPRELSYLEYDVVRPVAAPRGDWSHSLYMRGMARWLKENLEQFDCVYVDSMREEAVVAREVSLKLKRPLVVRCSSCGEQSDFQWAASSRQAKKIFRSGLMANVVIAPDAAAARGLIAFGADKDSILRIDDGIPSLIRRDPNSTDNARSVLSSINRDLYVPREGQVLLTCCRLTNEAQAVDFSSALVPILRRYPHLKAWIIGDGPARQQIHHLFSDAGVRHAVALPGSFGHDDELYQAADFYVHFSPDDGLQHRVPSAVSAALPILCVDNPATRAFFSGVSDQVRFYLPANRQQLDQAVDEVLTDLEAADRIAIQLRSTMMQTHSRQKSIDQHTQLFRSLIRDARGSHTPFSDEATA